MKLLVSDYDGTLKPDVKNLVANIDAIIKFRKNGHVFMISTGRSYISIKKEIDKFNIPYDFLSCNDGAILFDKDSNILYKDVIEKDILINILNDLKQFLVIKRIDMCGLYDFSKDVDEILEIMLLTKLLKSKKELKQFLSINYPELFYITFPDATFIEKKGGKSRSIKQLQSMIKVDQIITVGDARNDIEMLKDYDGYKMLESYPALYGKGIKTCYSVKTLVRKII